MLAGLVERNLENWVSIYEAEMTESRKQTRKLLAFPIRFSNFTLFMPTNYTKHILHKFNARRLLCAVVQSKLQFRQQQRVRLCARGFQPLS